MKILQKVNSPEDLKKLNIKELKQYCDEVRQYIIDVVKKTGGHLAPSLGTVELTVALHYVFDTPKDKIVWDVGHQVYTHKIITSRRDRFPTLRQWGGISGFTKRDESEYDPFGAGHASTAISAALGIKTALELKGDDSKVIAVVGDGAMTGGLAYEGLNNLGELQKNMLVILNDNRMSISPNVGGIRKYLSHLIANPGYNNFKKYVEHLIQLLPKSISKRIENFARRFLEAVKSLLVNNQFFEVMGIHYIGPVDGHNLEELIKILEYVKNSPTPTLLHIHTVKGKGYRPAEDDAEKFHGINPMIDVSEYNPEQSFSEVFGEIMVSLAEKRKDVVAITAAMKTGTGLTEFARRFPERFFDVGIAEGHALTFAAGLATEGVRPVAAIYSTFLQRGYDQIIHDIALQRLPVIMAIDRAGVVGEDGPTHHGMFDIAYLLPVPNLTIISPANKRDMEFAFDFAVNNNGPVAIRYPRGKCPDYEIEGKVTADGYFVVNSKSNEVLLIGVGRMVNILLPIAQEFNIALFNPLFLKPINEKLYMNFLQNYKRIVVVEDAIKTGGFHQYLRSVFPECQKIEAITFPDDFIPHGAISDIFKNYEMDSASLKEKIQKILNV